MGVVRPPWVTKTWFAECPFNYCDHFGDKYVLATICRICKDEIVREKLYKKAGKDPHDMKEVFKDIGNSFAYSMYLLHKHAEEMGIDLDNLDDVELEEAPPHKTHQLFNEVSTYGKAVEALCKKLVTKPVLAGDIIMIEKALEVLWHSRYYMLAKIGRAYSSKWKEAKDPEDDLDDSKTSAFFAYIAIIRNEHAIRKLLREGIVHHGIIRLAVQVRRASEEIAEYIRQEFFPKDKLIYKEFGCESYNDLFGISRQKIRFAPPLSKRS